MISIRIAIITCTMGLSLLGCQAKLTHVHLNPLHVKRTQVAQHKHQEKFIKDLEKLGTKFIRDTEEIRFVLPADTSFEANSSLVNDNFKEQLNIFAKLMKNNPYFIAEIFGNTDSTGNVEHNKALSERRAHAVITFLESKGIPGNRLLPIGLSKNQPLASNQSAEGRTINRRVEIILHQGQPLNA